MLTAEQLIPFLLAVGLIELTPGPNMAYLAIISSRSGWKAGMTTVAGVTLAFVIYLAASILGLAEAALRWPWLLEALRWGGIGYLVWLAADTWRAHASPVRPTSASGNLFLHGLVNNLLNPKAALLYVALLPGFVRADTGSPLIQSLCLGGVHIAVSVLIHTSIVWSASRTTIAVGSAASLTAARRRERLLALALFATAVWLAFSPVRAPGARDQAADGRMTGVESVTGPRSRQAIP